MSSNRSILDILAIDAIICSIERERESGKPFANIHYLFVNLLVTLNTSFVSEMDHVIQLVLV